MPEGSHYSNTYSNPEWEEEWETGESSHYSNPYSTPEMEWETAEGSHYSNPYSNPEWEEEWETAEGHPYSNPEWEYEADRFIPLIAKAATKLIPKAVKIGRNLIRGMRRGPVSRSARRPRRAGGRNQQISSLFYQLGRIFAQGESEASALEAHLFGANEFETEVAAHEMAHQAALTEVMAAEAAHTESEGEAQALLGAALPMSMNVACGRVDIRRLTPTLLRVNAQLTLKLHRQGKAGRQLLRVMPAVQRRTVSSLKAIRRSGRPVTPALAAKVMTGQAARVLATPDICRRVLTRNMIVRQQTVAPSGPGASPGTHPGSRPGRQVPRRRGYRSTMYRPGRPGMVPRRPLARPGMRMPSRRFSRPSTRIPGGPGVRPGMRMPRRPFSLPGARVAGAPGVRPGMRMPSRPFSRPGTRVAGGPGIHPGMRVPRGPLARPGVRAPGGPARVRSTVSGRPVSRPRASAPVGRPVPRAHRRTGA